MIRRAIMTDMDALVELARNEHLASGMRDTLFDDGVVRARMGAAVSGLSTAVFVSETDGKIDGLIAGMVQPYLYNRMVTA